MTSRDLFAICARNLLRRRTRTLLAVVGVVVGTCAIIVMLSIGFGLSASFQEQIESYGNLHLIDVYSGGGGMMGAVGGMDDGTQNKDYGKLNDRTIAAIGKLPEVEGVSPIINEYLAFGIGKYIMNSEVIGIRPDVMEKFGYELQEGRLLTAGDKNTIVFGNQVPSWFYNPRKTQGSSWGGEAQVNVITDKIIMTGDMYYGQKRPSGESDDIKYQEYKVKGVGVLANPNDESSWSVFMDFDSLKKIQDDMKRARKETVSSAQSTEYNQAKVYVGDINDVETVSEYIRETLGLQTNSLNDWLKSMQETAHMIQGILGGIGAISLLVAALGIANTMIMSIYERTKEIGVMKVIGANLKDIRKMFLLEAAMIGGLGGALGVIISFLVSLLMNTVLLPFMQAALGAMGGGGSVVSIIPWWVAAGGFVFAILIGVLSGYYPARRAMRLSALESLKNE